MKTPKSLLLELRSSERRIKAEALRKARVEEREKKRYLSREKQWNPIIKDTRAMLLKVVTAFEEASYIKNKTVRELLGVFVEFRPLAYKIVLWAKGPSYEVHFESGESMGSFASGHIEKHPHTYEVLLCNQKYLGDFFRYMCPRNSMDPRNNVKEDISIYNRGPVVSGPNKLFSVGFTYRGEPCCLWPLTNNDFTKNVSVKALRDARDFLTKVVRPGKIEDLLLENEDLKNMIKAKILEVKNSR